MAKTTEELNIKITGDSKRAKTALDKTKAAIGGVGDKAKKQASLLKNFKQNWIGITAALGGTVLMIKSALTAYAKQEEVEAKLNAVLKSTGFAAGITADELKKLASGLQQVTKFGDEAIIEGQGLLLTFTSIGKDIMPATTEAMLNMSEMMKTDLKSSAILLGKALNEPLVGVTALQRVGIKLSDTQKEQIQSFMDVSDIAGAQKIILGELETQMGGVARAAADTFGGAVISLKNAFGDLQEGIGEVIADALLPLIKVLKIVFEKMDAMPKSVKMIGVVFGVVMAGMIAGLLLFKVTLDAATLGITLAISAAVAGIIWMAANWDEVRFAFEVAWSAIKIGLLEAGAFILEYVPIMFAPWLAQIELIIIAINLFREEKLKSLTQMTADVQAAAETQLLLEQDNLTKILTAHRTAAAEKKKIKEQGTRDTETELQKQLKAYITSFDKVKTVFTDAQTAITKISDTLITSTLAGIETMKSSSKEVFASIVKSFAAMISGELAIMAANHLKEGIARTILLDPSAALQYIAAGVYTAAAGTVKAMGGTIAGKILSAAGGVDFVASRPQMMVVGDAPTPEHVQVTPEGQGGGGEISISIGNLTVMSNDVDEMTDKIFEAAELSGARLFRRGSFA